MDTTIAAIAAFDGLPQAQPTAGTAAPASGFAQLIDRGLAEIDASTRVAEAKVRDLAAGKPVELHEVMIALEEARISVQTFVQVRNKLVESYQDLMRMQM